MAKRSKSKHPTLANHAARRIQIVYGATYLDANETLESAKFQIDAVIGQAQAQLPHIDLVLVFDLVATPAQIQSGLARAVGQHLLDYLDQHYPGMTRMIGITDDDNRRVMRDILLTQRLPEKDIDDVHLFEME